MSDIDSLRTGIRNLLRNSGLLILDSNSIQDEDEPRPMFPEEGQTANTYVVKPSLVNAIQYSQSNMGEFLLFLNEERISFGSCHHGDITLFLRGSDEVQPVELKFGQYVVVSHEDGNAIRIVNSDVFEREYGLQVADTKLVDEFVGTGI